VTVEHLPLTRLLSLALRNVIDDLHTELATEGFPGLRPAYGYALYAISTGVGTAGELAAHLGMTKQGAAKLVDTLAADGYIQRAPHPQDQRAKLLTLTRRGERLLDASTRIQRQLEDQWGQILGPRSARSLRSHLEKLVDSSPRGPQPLRPPW